MEKVSQDIIKEGDDAKEAENRKVADVKVIPDEAFESYPKPIEVWLVFDTSPGKLRDR